MQIHFDPAEVWEKWGENYEADPDSFIVDLRGASSEDEIVGRLRDVLKAVKYPTVTPFLGLDALNEALSDFFYERWNTQTEIYILGWKDVMERLPLLSQKIICVFVHAYCSCVWRIARLVAEGEEDMERARIHQNISEGVFIFMILN